MAIDFPTDFTDTEPTEVLGTKAGSPNVPAKASIGATGLASMAAANEAAGRNAIGVESTLLSGAADPTGTDGLDGDFWLRTDTNVLFGPKAAGTWPTPGTSLVGPAGADGSDGADGRTILNGTVDPTTEGEDGDFYLNTDTSTLFGPKAAGAWPAGTSLVGPTGATGADGTDGTDGTNGTDGTDGTDGKTILNGTVDPVAGDGVDGDFFLNTTSNEFFGPKAGGSWPASGIVLSHLDKAQTFTKAQRGALVTLDNSSALEPLPVPIDMAAANNFRLEMLKDSVLQTPTNIVAGQGGFIQAENGPVAGYTLTYDTGWIFPDGVAPIIDIGANATTLLTYYAISSTQVVISLAANYVRATP